MKKVYRAKGLTQYSVECNVAFSGARCSFLGCSRLRGLPHYVALLHICGIARSWYGTRAPVHFLLLDTFGQL